MSKKIKVAIVGASGLSGKELISILESSSLNISELHLFASSVSAGEKIDYKDDILVIRELKNADSIDADLVFLATDSLLSLELAPKLRSKGMMVIDKSTAFREKELLIIPSINGDLLNKVSQASIIASPNCVVVPICEVLYPIHKKYGLLQVIVSTYQAVSGAGKKAIDELEKQVRDLFNLRESEISSFDKQIAFNVLPNIPSFGELNQLLQTQEEEKIIQETKKILKLSDLLMQVTCVRVPVFNGHSMSVSIATEEKVDIEEVKNLLSSQKGIILHDDIKSSSYPTPLESSGIDDIIVGRIRPNTAVKNGVSLFICADNLRVGASLNAARIAAKLYEEN